MTSNGQQTTTGASAATVRRASRLKGRAREAEIIAAVRDLLAGGRYDQFTLRNVAARVGIRISHLQYYFATKGDLIRGLLASVAADYSAQTAQVLAQVPDTPTARFMSWIDFLLQDCWDPRTRHFFIQLWGLVESEDAYTGQLLQQFYATDISEILQLLRDLSPHLDARLLGQRAAIIAGLIEGMMLMVGSEPDDADTRKGLLAETRKQIFRIATEA
ncbi:MAG: TetR/AcrR family transcriptional regulator [Lysobacterales bacterium]|jgi:AcrR family transcriptional regulator|nr:MAG: TetR/AcrR family transcriptional regulator [Xanthomonadales bacterium]